MPAFDPAILIFASAVAVIAGAIKGAVGFAMPMLMLSALGSVLPPEQALALLIMPTLITNLWQSLRQGLGAAMGSIRRHRLLIGTVMGFICVSAGFARIIPQAPMLALLGVPITAFAALQLSGRPLVIPLGKRRRAEFLTGMIGGLFGGISGIWGPPVLVYLVSANTEKREQVRVQGVVFLLGAVILALAHLVSGVLNPTTLPVSAALAVPAMIGMALGFAVQDRLDLAQFRRWTLIILLIAGLNLIRRAVELAAMTG